MQGYLNVPRGTATLPANRDGVGPPDRRPPAGSIDAKASIEGGEAVGFERAVAVERFDDRADDQRGSVP